MAYQRKGIRSRELEEIDAERQSRPEHKARDVLPNYAGQTEVPTPFTFSTTYSADVENSCFGFYECPTNFSRYALTSCDEVAVEINPI